MMVMMRRAMCLACLFSLVIACSSTDTGGGGNGLALPDGKGSGVGFGDSAGQDGAPADLDVDASIPSQTDAVADVFYYTEETWPFGDQWSEPEDAWTPPGDLWTPVEDQWTPQDWGSTEDLFAPWDSGSPADSGGTGPLDAVQYDGAGTPVVGCDGSKPADGFSDIGVTPDGTTVAMSWNTVKQVKFTAFGIKPSGQKEELSNVKWEVSPPPIGAIDANGLLTVNGVWGGATKVYAKYKTLCGEATVMVKLLYADTTGTSLGAGAIDAVTNGPAPKETADFEVLYPPDKAMAPADFPAITPQWNYSGPGVNLFVLRLESAGGVIDVAAEPSKWQKSGGYAFTFATDTWKKLFTYPTVQKWTWRVLAANVSGGKVQGDVAASAPRTLHIAQDKTGGAIYYWNTQLSSIRVLEPGQAPVTTPLKGGICAGCHSVSPDGSTIAVSYMVGAGFSSMSMGLSTAKSGLDPPWLHANAKSLLASSFTISAAFSKAWFNPAKKWLVVPTSGVASMFPLPPKLTAVDLVNGTSKVLVTGGDKGQAAFPTWSPDGSLVVYGSSKDVGGGFSAPEPTALYSVPFNGGQGGSPKLVPGTDTPGVFHYYPAFTPDGKYVAYNRATQMASTCPSSSSSGGGGQPSNGGDSGTYDNCHADLYIVDPVNGPPIRLELANGSATDGLTNSWPTFGGVYGNYYWMAFSSRRNYGFILEGNPASPEIWIAAIDPVAIANGEDGSYAALWLPGQDLGAGNHIARWSAPPRDD